MLEMRLHCECCQAALPAEASGAYICSFECTFCVACAQGPLALRCPNCAGILAPRPARAPDQLARHPASARRIVRATPCVPHWEAGHGLD